MESEGCAEDVSIGVQLEAKLRKTCQRVQSPFHSLAARVILVNSILMGQLLPGALGPYSGRISGVETNHHLFLMGEECGWWKSWC